MQNNDMNRSLNLSQMFSEMFLCSICLEVFSEPVSTPCGHNFCKRCISQTWDTNESCFCPLCKEVFSIRPQLKTNTFISEMVSQWKLEEERRSKRVSKPVEVKCDFCSEPKLKAVKSCLVCLSSFCESHLQPHLSAPRLKRHQLMEPVDDLEDRMCPTHQRPLELFCGTDKSCVCTMCVPLEHKKHELLSLEEAFEQEKVSLQQTRCLDHHTKVMEQSLSKHKERAQALIQQLHLSQKFNKVFTQLPPKDQLRRVQQFAVDVTLDPDTANPALVLSKDLKQVHCGDVVKELPDSPQRFTNHVIVLGKQSFSSGRFYFEVQVKGKTEWDLGVARESVNRKGQISLSPENGFWTIWLRNRDEYKRPPQKVGVFVDYGAGLVSFYDVDSADLLYSFTNCSFREKLFPYFEPCPNKGGTNSAPLIISAVETK
uniref:Bloodthirsty n=1 Tax=Neogobius melanostomus TaxID=47308 RepID=A0A8C6T8A2_9GOBI